MDNDPNGTRLDKIERIMLRMIEHHEAEFKAMRTWQVLTQGHMDDLREAMKEQGKRFDEFVKTEAERGLRIDKQCERIDDLVAAIRSLIDRIPPENLR
jgi:hypothetical protein